MVQSIAALSIPPQGPSTKLNKKAPGRLLYIDNLRWVMIMLVVSMHAAVTYSHLGSWYYMEDRAVSVTETGIFATYQVTLQSFFMGFLFLIAGYFVPAAYDAKGPAKFLRDRLFRLGWPLLLYMFVLQPLAIYCIYLFHTETVFTDGFGTWYVHYLTHGRWVGGTGPLWFCEALLILCFGYTLYRIAGRRFKRERENNPPLAEERHNGVLPSKGWIWAFIFLITGLTFAVRFPWPNGTSFYNLQFCYCSQYVLFFAAGTLAFRGGWLKNLPKDTGKYWGGIALAGLILCWPALLVLGNAFKGQLPAYQGGLHWQSLGMSLWESMMGVAISLYLLAWFGKKFNQQGGIARYFSANAFAVYVFHAPILIALSRVLSPWQTPLLLKFVILTAISISVSYVICSLVLRKLPLLKKIL